MTIFKQPTGNSLKILNYNVQDSIKEAAKEALGYWTKNSKTKKRNMRQQKVKK